MLVSPGVYKESVTIGTDGIVLRGVDRNRTILDGEFKRDNGVFVVGGDGVAVENLTARNYTENGFFWNGVLGYRGSYLTAYRNGDYGVYAYDSQYGQLRALVRVGQSRLRLLHRPVQPVPRGDHRRRVRVQPARVLGVELVGRPVPRELGVVAQPHRHRARTASAPRSSRRRARPRSPGTSSATTAIRPRDARERGRVRPRVRRRRRDRRRSART